MDCWDPSESFPVLLVLLSLLFLSGSEGNLFPSLEFSGFFLALALAPLLDIVGFHCGIPFHADDAYSSKGLIFVVLVTKPTSVGRKDFLHFLHSLIWFLCYFSNMVIPF